MATAAEEEALLISVKVRGKWTQVHREHFLLQALRAHRNRTGTSWIPGSSTDPWSWYSPGSGAVFETMGLSFVIARADLRWDAISIHAAPTEARALAGDYHEPVVVRILGLQTRAVGLVLEKTLRELEHIERTVGLDRGLPL